MLGITTTGLSSSSNYNNRIFYVEVKGLGGNDLVRTSHHTLTVPYSQLSKTMQRINRLGGHIVSVKPESALHLTEALADYLYGMPAEVTEQEQASDAGDAQMSKGDDVTPAPEIVDTSEPESSEAKAGDAQMSKGDDVTPAPEIVETSEPQSTEAKADEPAEVISAEPESTEAKADEPAEVISAEPESSEAKADEPAEVISAEPENSEAKADEPAEVISAEPESSEAKADEPVESKGEEPAEETSIEAKTDQQPTELIEIGAAVSETVPVEASATTTKKSTKSKGIQPTKTTKKSTKTTTSKKTRKSK